MKHSCLAVVLVVLAVMNVFVAGCGMAGSTTTSSATDPPVQQSTTAETLPAPDGWSIRLIPGTDKMIPELEQDADAGQSNVTMSRPAPPMFEPSVAVDGERVVFSALYAQAPQVYLYDIPSGAVAQLTDDAPASYLEQLQVQISGDWVAWMRGYNTNDIHLLNLMTGETKQFSPEKTVVSWRLVGNRLAWEEMEQLHEARLYLYDPADGSVQTIDAAHGLLCFDIDNNHIAWAGGPGWNELYLYDLASGETKKVAQDSQQVGEYVVVKGDILTWTDRTDDRTTLVVYRLDTGEKKVVDTFGPFNPELQSDGRYVAWNRGEQDAGTEVWVYDTETGKTIDLGGTWPSIDDGCVAWLRSLPGPSGQEIVTVRDLAGGPTTQLTNGRWSDQPPVVNGGHVVWTRRNPSRSDSQGRGIFVATAPVNPPAAAATNIDQAAPPSDTASTAASIFSTTSSTEATPSASSIDTTVPQPINGGPGTPEYDGVPWPIVDGGWRYLGDGRFVTESDHEFFWRDGRFLNPDGTLMEIPASVKEHLQELGIERQPTIPASLPADKPELANEVERIRKGLIAGTLVFNWNPPKDSDFSSDPLKVLDSLEASAYTPDVQVFLKDSAGYAEAFRKEIMAMPEVEEMEFVSKGRALKRLQEQFKDRPEILSQLESNPLPASISIWLKDHRRYDELVEKLRGRPEVEEAKGPSIDFALWTRLLRDMARPK